MDEEVDEEENEGSAFMTSLTKISSFMHMHMHMHSRKNCPHLYSSWDE